MSQSENILSVRPIYKGIFSLKSFLLLNSIEYKTVIKYHIRCHIRGQRLRQCPNFGRFFKGGSGDWGTMSQLWRFFLDGFPKISWLIRFWYCLSLQGFSDRSLLYINLLSRGLETVHILSNFLVWSTDQKIVSSYNSTQRGDN